MFPLRYKHMSRATTWGLLSDESATETRHVTEGTKHLMEQKEILFASTEPRRGQKADCTAQPLRHQQAERNAVHVTPPVPREGHDNHQLGTVPRGDRGTSLCVRAL